MNCSVATADMSNRLATAEPPAASRTEALPTAAGVKALPGRIPELDGLRGLAILLVLAWHYVHNQLGPASGAAGQAARWVLAYSWSGVDLFFVLSGFLLGGILLDNRSSPHYFKAFYVRRMCRIFPLYYAWLGVIGLLMAVGVPGHWRPLISDSTPFWSYLTYTQNVLYAALGEFGSVGLRVTWSLAVEEQFYLLLPLLIRLSRPERLPQWLIILVLTAMVSRVFCFFQTPDQGLAGYVLLPCRWDALFLGVLTAWLVRKPGFAEGFRSREWFVWRVAGLIAIATLGFVLAKQDSFLSLANHLLGFSLLAVLYCLLLLSALYSGHPALKAVFCSPWLRWLGVISYCVYLIHQPVAFLCHTVLLHSAAPISTLTGGLATLAALALTLGLASLSWRFLESRCVAWGRKFAYSEAP